MQLNLEQVNADLAAKHPRDIIQWADQTFGRQSPNGLIMTSSFGAESMCLIHLATQVKPDIKIVVVNTGYLFQETLDFMTQMRRDYKLNLVEYKTKNDPITWLTINGEDDPTVRKNVDACCAANKNEVFDRAMRELAPLAWLRGVRADQSSTRATMQHVQWSKRNNCYAVSPILKWSRRDIYTYMQENKLPFHPLWEKGYTSIGCSPATCTAPIVDPNDPRGGRWAGMNKKECGIHLEN